MENSQVPQQNFTPNQPPSAIPSLNPEPVKRHSKLKKVLIIIGILILLWLAGVGYLVYTASKVSPQLQVKATNFLTLVSNNNYDSAYNLTSSDFQKTATEEDFKQFMTSAKAEYSGFSSLKQTGFYVRAQTGQPTMYEFSGEITYSDGELGDLTIRFVKEDNDWKVLYVNVSVKSSRLKKFN